MSLSLSLGLKAEEVKTLGFASIGVGYMGIGTALENPARIIIIQNLTDALLMFSLDGIIDNFPQPASGYLVLDITSNKASSSGIFIAKNQRFYVREMTTPTVGAVYVSSFYGANI